MRKLLMILAIISIVGCSSKEMYNTLRLNQRVQCVNKLPSSYDECVERTEKSYEEYEREHKATLESHKRKELKRAPVGTRVIMAPGSGRELLILLFSKETG